MEGLRDYVCDMFFFSLANIHALSPLVSSPSIFFGSPLLPALCPCDSNGIAPPHTPDHEGLPAYGYQGGVGVVDVVGVEKARNWQPQNMDLSPVTLLMGRVARLSK